MEGTMFSSSITIGTIAITRLSTAAVVQVVQPRLDPPATTNPSTFTFPASALPQKAITVSIARSAALVIGKRAGHLGSPVRINLSHV
jgi:negative regulator of sigma E activity